jgi:biotin carboxyl carrier protein
MAEPSTRFMQSYLAAVGSLGGLAQDLDLDMAFAELQRRAEPEARPLLAAKETLLERPLANLISNPHAFGGFLGRYDGELWRAEAGQVRFAANPVHFLERLLHFLDLEDRPSKPPSERLWDHDREVLDAALGFYREVEARTGVRDKEALDALFASAANVDLVGSDAALWERCQAAHRGHQLGLELLLLIPRIGLRSGFLEVTINEALQPRFPERFTEAASMASLARNLAPPPPAAADEIVTPMGGTFYAREAPQLPPLVSEGDHFDAGQPLFVIEVMKMFNKVLAPFAGTVVENRMRDQDGTVVKKGQVIFRIEPDERVVVEAPEAIAARRREVTLSLLE